MIAVALTPLLPAGLPLLAALGGLGTRWSGWRRLVRRLSRPGGNERGQHDRQPRGDGQSGGGANDDEMTVGGRR